MVRFGIARCLCAALLFGASTPAASELASDMSTFALAGLLYLGAALAVTPVMVRRPPSWRALRAEWRPTTVAVVAGGAVGPALLVAGLARSSAASASILLNLELVATVVLASTIFREHLGRRVIAGAALVTAGGVVLVWEPGATNNVSIGALFVAAACVAWGIDNGVTARIDQLAPEHVVFFKGAVAGGANLALGFALGGSGPTGAMADVAVALVIGALGHGWSITLWVKGARDLGAARGQVIFAAAPFFGAVVAWTALAETIDGTQVVALVLAATGVGVSLRSAHEHRHRHGPVVHDHEHTHDDHHDHEHFDGFTGRHAHPHRHEPAVHTHPHVPDLHHRHRHGDD